MSMPERECLSSDFTCSVHSLAHLPSVVKARCLGGITCRKFTSDPRSSIPVSNSLREPQKHKSNTEADHINDQHTNSKFIHSLVQYYMKVGMSCKDVCFCGSSLSWSV